MNRVHIDTLAGGLKIYEVQLVGGPADGLTSICSHDKVIWGDENAAHEYLRGVDDRYYYTPPTNRP